MSDDAFPKSILFSIIIPTKNEEDYISSCLKGIAALDFDKDRLEIIVVDNASTDKTCAISERMGATVISVVDVTIAASRNKGAEAAKGKILAFIDADCIPDQEWLNNALPYFDAPEIASVGSEPALPQSGTTWVEEAWSVMKQKPARGETQWLSSCNFLIRKTVFDEIDGFDASLRTCEDADICFRLVRRWKIVNDPGIKVVHLREPKTIVQFVKKEVWHGSDNYTGLFNHGFVIHELPSLVVPFWCLVFGLLLIWTTLQANYELGFVLLVLFFCLPFALMFRVMLRTRTIAKFFPVFILFIFYAMARSFALINMVFKKKVL